jgi:hypothetical protein
VTSSISIQSNNPNPKVHPVHARIIGMFLSDQDGDDIPWPTSTSKKTNNGSVKKLWQHFCSIPVQVRKDKGIVIFVLYKFFDTD